LNFEFILGMNKKKEAKNFSKSSFAQMEEKILDFWDEHHIFQKSVETPASQGGEEAPKGDYVFYDGPPFGTGEPHYGHLLSSISKDVVPRYWTMKGYRVERRWGWDCHGLPIENIIEKDLGISGKKDIEDMGVDKFNEACRARVLEYSDIWDGMVRRIGRWVDFKNAYKTMDPDFMESVWWGFKQIWNKDLVYEGRRVLLYCPRCETPISNFEVAMDNSYKDITETSVYVKFKITEQEKLGKEWEDKDVYILAWTTTPWTLPANVALAAGGDIDYVLVAVNNEYVILAKERVEEILEDREYKIEAEFKGKDLQGIKYHPLFRMPAVADSGKDAYYVALADFVTTEDGTGIVHTAVVYGEDDYNLGVKLDLPVIPSLDNKGHFNDKVPELEGIYFKKADSVIVEKLEEQDLLFSKKDITHSYPHCHRCDTQLFYNAIPAWFFNIGNIRKRMLELNENINWHPDYLKYGRFAQGIEQAPDWNISRNRYFATPMPVWRCESCGNIDVIGSIKELQEKSGEEEIKDIHNHYIDHLRWECAECGAVMKRIPEVFDCWVESGSMPFAQNHYMGEPLRDFDPYRGLRFPAQFISEYISQTRAWFYVMHAISTALFDSNSFENVVTTGVILTDKGEKMSKSKKNFPNPQKVIDEFGVDALRYYLMSSSVMHAENLFFNENELKDVFRKNIMLVWNVYKFYGMFAPEAKAAPEYSESKNILDQWIFSKLNKLIADVTYYMENYDLPRAVRPITAFIDDLSTWYLRRSRDRFKDEDKEDRDIALATTGYALYELSRVMAPVMPFMAEELWQRITGNNYASSASVHLEPWPVAGVVDEQALEEMSEVREIVELGLAQRDKTGIRVRQPLSKLTVKNENRELGKDHLDLIADEVNVKEVELVRGSGTREVELDTNITAELEQEGIKRELVRYINALRKRADLTIEDGVDVYWESSSEKIKSAIDAYSQDIQKSTLADSLQQGEPENATADKKITINEREITLYILAK
jgi:isoleucyl-tRNA synthetase